PRRALPPAFARTRQRRAPRVERWLSLLGAGRRQRRVGQQPRPPRRVVGVAAADAGHGALVAEHRVDAATVVTVQDQLGELIGIRLRAEALDRTDLAFGDDPPARLAFRAVLAQQERHIVVETQPNYAALACAGRL